MAQQTIPEDDLLASVDTGVTSAWPTFVLTDIDVVDVDGHPVSLFGLSDGLSRTLTGQLQPLEDDQAHLLKTRSLRRAPCIEITDVKMYTWHLDEEDLILRTAGQAGWYMLQPSEAYTAIWHEMKLAVKMFLWIADVHRKRMTTKTRRNDPPFQDWPVEQLFEAYGLECFRRPKMAPEAAQKLFRHKEFLLESMLAKEADIDWTNTPLYLHLAMKFPKQFKAAKAYVATVEARKSPETLPIRSSASASKRKHEQTVGPAPENPRPVSKRKASQQQKPLSTLPSTPRTGHLLDRREFAMKGRSALRPSAVKPSKNAQQSVPFTRSDEDSEDDSEGKDTDSDSDIDELDAAVPGNDTAHLATSSDSLEAETSDEQDSGDERSASSLAAKLDASEASDKDQAISQMEVWHCNAIGCSHKIAAASQPDLQVLTEEHVALHAFDHDARVRLVQQLKHASLPVAHLMEKVRHQARTDHHNLSRTNNVGNSPP